MTPLVDEEVKVTFLPGGREAVARPGQSLLEAARGNGLAITSVCGGKGTCGKCRVLIEGPVDASLSIERVHLSQEDLSRGVRLACQTRPHAGQVVRVLRPAGGRTRILKGGSGRKVVLAPNVRKVCLAAPPPSLDGPSDWERVAEAAPLEAVQPDLTPLRQLPGALRASPGAVTLALRGGRLASVEVGDTTSRLYGLAFDIGTTTVVGYLMDLRTGRELAAASALNPQATHGGDLVSRLNFVQEDPNGLSTLQAEVVSLLNQLIEEVAAHAGIERGHIYEVTIVGNVVMHHLLLGIDPSGLAGAPCTPVVRESLDLPASEVGLDLGPQAWVHVLPNIAGFVGADLVGTLLTLLPTQSSQVLLIIDLGTNGEIAMGSRERLLVCSTAAGPAFEGARIRHGMQAASGAIDRVRIDDDVRYRVIDGGAAAGICGSGLVDAVAQMVERGIVNASGRLLKPAELAPGIGPRLQARVKGSGRAGDELRFVLVPGEASQTGAEISVTQQDIRELQLAKGAICAGIQVLKEELNVQDKDISQVLLAGAFGTYVSAASARRIGLIPPLPLERVQAVGNTAGFGAQLALLSTAERKIADLIARQAEHIRLSGRADFQDYFVQALHFPA